MLGVNSGMRMRIGLVPAVGLCAGSATIAFVLWIGPESWRSWWTIPVVLITCIVYPARVLLTSVRVDEGTVVVRNPFRTHRLELHEVAAIESARYATPYMPYTSMPALRLQPDEGRGFHLVASANKPASVLQSFAAQLHELDGSIALEIDPVQLEAQPWRRSS